MYSKIKKLVMIIKEVEQLLFIVIKSRWYKLFAQCLKKMDTWNIMITIYTNFR